jgi:hypothetical protein
MLGRSPTATSHGLAVPVKPPSSSGLGLRPFKAAARVRIPLGARTAHGPVEQLECSPPCQGGGRGFKSRQDRQCFRRSAPCNPVVGGDTITGEREFWPAFGAVDAAVKVLDSGSPSLTPWKRDAPPRS